MSRGRCIVTLDFYCLQLLSIICDMLWNDMVNCHFWECKWLVAIEALLSIYAPESKMLCNCKFVFIHCIVAIEKKPHWTRFKLYRAGKGRYRIPYGFILILKSSLSVKIWATSV